jgi:hypothetical protein
MIEVPDAQDILFVLMRTVTTPFFDCIVEEVDAVVRVQNNR